MTSNVCFLCNVTITKTNDSREHIIPNALGGRKKIKSFICRTCNNTTGTAWDSVLCKQLNPLSLQFGISREDGEIQPHVFETTGSESLLLLPDGTFRLAKPKLSMTEEDGVVTINLEARSFQEAKSILGGIREKYPQAAQVIDQSLAEAVMQTRYPEDPIKFSLAPGGPEGGRSIVKTALALAAFSGIQPQSCTNAVAYLTDPNAEACFGFYYEHDLVQNRPVATVFHCVSIQTNPDTKQLLAYVEYYSIYRMVVCLSNNYSGPSLSTTYAIDPITGSELDFDVKISLTQEDIALVYQYKKIWDDSIPNAFKAVYPIARKRAYQLEIERILLQTFDEACKKMALKEDDELTEEVYDRLNNLHNSLFRERMLALALHSRT